jgi:hypothetical protein
VDELSDQGQAAAPEGRRDWGVTPGAAVGDSDVEGGVRAADPQLHGPVNSGTRDGIVSTPAQPTRSPLTARSEPSRGGRVRAGRCNSVNA